MLLLKNATFMVRAAISNFQQLKSKKIGHIFCSKILALRNEVLNNKAQKLFREMVKNLWEKPKLVCYDFREV
jgi:hypothetical protein